MKRIILLLLTSTVIIFACENRASEKMPAVTQTAAKPTPQAKPGQNVDDIVVTVKLNRSEKKLITSSLSSLPYNVADPVLAQIDSIMPGDQAEYEVKMKVATIDIILAALQEQVYKFVFRLNDRLLSETRAQVDQQLGTDFSKAVKAATQDSTKK